MIGVRSAVLALALACAMVLAAACGDDSSDQSVELPDDLPIFEGASKESEEERDGTLWVTYTVDAPREDVVTFYRRSLDTDPWLVTNFTDQVDSGGATVVFRRIDDTVVGTTDVTHEGDSGTRFVIALSPNVLTPSEDTETRAPSETATASPSTEATQ